MSLTMEFGKVYKVRLLPASVLLREFDEDGTSVWINQYWGGSVGYAFLTTESASLAVWPKELGGDDDSWCYHPEMFKVLGEVDREVLVGTKLEGYSF